MKRAVLFSIKPKWVERILSGEKTIEVRKTSPKIQTPFKCYIYCTQSGIYKDGISVKNIWINRGTENRFIGNGKVVGEFVCDEIETYLPDDLVGAEDFNGTIRENPIDGEYAYWIPNQEQTCLNYCEILKYGAGKTLYGLHITNVKIFDEPKDITDFTYFKKCRRCNRKETGLHTTCDFFDENCEYPVSLERPPQSWCYVEDLGG